MAARVNGITVVADIAVSSVTFATVSGEFNGTPVVILIVVSVGDVTVKSVMVISIVVLLISVFVAVEKSSLGVVDAGGIGVVDRADT